MAWNKHDGFVKSPQIRFPVIPVKMGIQSFQLISRILDFRLRGNDDFLRDHPE
jgi:hypothetical protein